MENHVHGIVGGKQHMYSARADVRKERLFLDAGNFAWFNRLLAGRSNRGLATHLLGMRDHEI